MGGEKRKKESKPWNSFYSCNTTQKQMAVLQVKKIQDDKSNELTVKILNKIPEKWIEPDS